MRRVLAAAAAMKDSRGRSVATLSAGAYSESPAPRVAVIGGGIAGLAAAKALLHHGVACTMIDAGRHGVGGRVSSHQLEWGKKGHPLSFDHGAQFFSAGSPDFQAEVAAWAEAGVAQEWRCRHGRIAADGTFHPNEPGSSDGGGGRPVLLRAAPGGDQRWVGVPSNAAIMQHIAGELQAAGGRQHGPQGRPLFELLSGLVVRSAERLGTSGCGSHGSTRWRLHGSRAERAAAAVPAHLLDGQEDLGGYDAVILADAMPLVPGSAGHVRGLEAASTSLGQLARSVQAVDAQPRFALMVAFHQPLRGVPFDFASVEHSSSSSGDGTGGGRSCGSCGCGSCGTGSGGAFALVACNSSKPGRPGSGDAGSASSDGVGDALECWVAISTAQRARQLLDQHPLVGPDGRHSPQTEQYRAEVAEELLADFRDLMAPFVQGYALPQPAYSYAQRWGRAFVTEPLGAEFLFLPAQKLALCGDVAMGSGVENAWRSGRAAGEAVGRMLRPAAVS